MSSPRSFWLVRAVLAVGALAAAAWLVRLDYDEKISTDVLDLIPRAERSPELALARTLASEKHARVALFALEGKDAEKRDAAASAFADVLRASGVFAEVEVMPDTTNREAFGRHVFENRFDLLLPGWLAARETEHRASGSTVPWPDWLAERAAVELGRFLQKPEAIAAQDIIPADPLLLVPGLLQRMPGIMEGSGASEARALIWARTQAAPLSEAGQGPVFAAVEQALGSARGIDGQLTLQWTSIGRFAAENRTRIERELSLLNIVSLVAVLAVALFGLRRPVSSLHLVPVVVGALVGAWCCTTAVFPRVHVLVFVIGSLLGGVAIDYGFYLSVQPPRRAGEPYWEKARRLMKPLLASALTTILGFALLLLSELPLIRQLGVFVSAGLIAALAAALLWFGQLRNHQAETRPLARARIAHPSRRIQAIARTSLIIGGIVALTGPWRLQWRDEIRELESIPESLRTEAAAVRSYFGESAGRTLYLTRGDSIADARTRLDGFLQWHTEKFPDATVASLGMVLPTIAETHALQQRLARLPGFEEKLRAALNRQGFDPDGFAPFFSALATWRSSPARPYDDVVRGFVDAARGPMALSLATTPGASWVLTISGQSAGARVPADLSTIPLDQLQSLNDLFSRYRRSALLLSSLGLILVGLSVFVLYGWRLGLRIFAVPAGSCLFAFGVLGFAGHTLNLFHLLGAFLGVCLSHNYAIFSAANAAAGEEPPPSIRLSALTTAASFGVLAFSRIPVVSALGVMVTLIVLTALCVVELTPLASARDEGASKRA